MDAYAIKAALNERAGEFANWLFPAGRKNGNEWQVGSLQGEAGKSLSIRVSGSKVGVFKDFATDDGGDNLVELFAQTRQVAFRDALHACAEWLGTSLTPTAGTVLGPRHKPSIRGCRPIDIYDPSGEDIQTVQRMVETLVSDSSLCELVQ